MTNGNGWAEVPLGELCRLVNGKAFKPSDWTDNGLPIIRIQNLNDETKPFNCWAGSLERQVMVNAGDVLLGWSGTPGTSFGAHIWSREQGVLNQHIFRVDLDETRIAKEWAVPAINHQLEVLIGKAHGGVGLRHVKKGEVESLNIPLPPLGEQTRIAGILKEQLAAVERARAAAEAQLEAAKVLPAAYLRDVFSTEVTQDWPQVPLGEIADIVSGITLGRKLKNGQPTTAVPYLRVANVKDGHLDLDDVYDIEATHAEIKKLQLVRGDILLTEGGDRDKLGRGTFWQEELPLCIHQNHIFRVRLDTERYLPEFISAEIGSAYGKAYFLAHAKQTTGIATINQTVLRGFPVLAPPIDEQRRITSRLRACFVKAADVESVVQSQVDAIEAMPAALLRAAFQGRL